jgi:hypothetical protein
MRRHVIFLPPLVALITFIACDDSNSNGGDGGTFNFDAGNFDGNIPPQPPPPVDDSGSDVADTGPAPVTVLVSFHGKPRPGIAVVAHDTTGAVIATNTTGADGKATFLGVSPSMVSALLGQAAGIGGHQIVTWLGVQPGDLILAQDIELSGAPIGIYTVSEGGVLDGGFTYSGYVGTCAGSNQFPFDIFVTFPCLRATNSLLVGGYDLNGGLVGYAFKRNAPTLATDGGTTPVTVGAWAAPGKTTVTVSNVPASGSGFANLWEITDGDSGVQNLTGGIANGTSTPFQTAPGFADALQGGFRFQPRLAPGSELTVAARTAVAADVAVDFATALPSVTDTTLDATDPSRPSVTIKTTGSLATTDGGAYYVAYSPPGADFPDSWLFVVPPDTTTVKAPAMPASANPWLPKPADAGGTFADPYIFFLETDALPGYTEFRQGAGTLVPYANRGGAESRIILPKNGSLRMSSFVRLPL